jgi:hypothetical protein
MATAIKKNTTDFIFTAHANEKGWFLTLTKFNGISTDIGQYENITEIFELVANNSNYALKVVR